MFRYLPSRIHPLLPIALALGLVCLTMRAGGWEESLPPTGEEAKPAAEASAPPKDGPPPAFSWDLSPYDVLLWVYAEPSLSLPEFASADWQKQLGQKVEAALGPGCVVRVALMPDGARRELRGSLSMASVAASFAAAPKPAPDKIFFVGGWEGTGDWPALEIRELDARLWNFGPLLSRELPHRALLGEEIARGVSDAFRPLAKIERVDERNSAMILPRAGELAIAGASRAEIRPGDILRAALRRADRFGVARPQDVNPIPWTYVAPKSLSGRFLQSQVVTALRQPLEKRVSSRVEKLALLVRPESEGTTLLLKGRKAPHPPLAGYEVFDLQGEGEPQPIGVSDGEGKVAIPPRAEGIYRLHVRHGREVLARLPLVPGAEREVTAFLADDGPRLDAEAYLAGFQETLIDTVARRQVAFARINRLLERGEIASAEREEELLRTLKTRQQLSDELGNQRSKFVSDDDAVKAKIKKLFDECSELLKKYLDPQEIEHISAKIKGAKQGAGLAPPM